MGIFPYDSLACDKHNTTIKPETYSLGDEIKVTLRKESAKMQVYNSAPQISGFDAAEVEKISSGNNVQPVTITVDKLLDFACMPVKIENVTIETAGIWKTEVDKASTHTFKANGSDLTVYINKGANSFTEPGSPPTKIFFHLWMNNFTQYAAQCRGGGGLGNKLRQDHPLLCAHCLADADLPGALCDRHQHDVHNADTAHQQRYAGDRSQDDDHHIDQRLLLLQPFDHAVHVRAA